MMVMMDGHVEVTLAGQSATLVPTLGCAMELCRRHGSLGDLLAKLESYDLPAAVDTVRCGLGRPERDHGAVAEDVFATGLVDLTAPLVRFVIILANGGKPLKREEGDEPGGPFGG
ncbi:hypothetical protein [Xanthobacter sediminis]